jgi:aspartate/tyrosine/aromatic aminotransferase
MFEKKPTPAAPDSLIAVMESYRRDPRPEKVDLGIGAYRDRNGHVAIMSAVKEAERLLLEKQHTKSYLGSEGDHSFNEAMIDLVFGRAAPLETTRACQTTGGSAAIRILAQLLVDLNPEATLWLPDPTWTNHIPLLSAAGIRIRRYPYYDAGTGGVRFGAMLDMLHRANSGDIVLLHACCHNPTGANLTPAEWQELASYCARRNLLPFLDVAYQGFGDGLEEDMAGLRIVARTVPEMVVAVSCSKNFTVYRDRVGAALLMGRTPRQAELTFGHLLDITRGLYFMPPDHGAATVSMLLGDLRLRSNWEEELTTMRNRLACLRKGFSAALRDAFGSAQFDHLARQQGMFSLLPLTASQTARLKDEHAVYLPSDGRINIAGLPEDRLHDVAQAFLKVMGRG